MRRITYISLFSSKNVYELLLNQMKVMLLSICRYKSTTLGLILLLLAGCSANPTYRDEQGRPIADPDAELPADQREQHEQWEYAAADKSEVLTIHLETDIRTQQVKGRHCYVTENGKKTDCADGKHTLNGHRSGKTIRIKLRTAFDNDSLVCHLVYTSDTTLRLEVKEASGPTLFRKDLVLRKVK